MGRYRKKAVEIDAVPVAEVFEYHETAPEMLPGWVVTALSPDPETDEGHGPDNAKVLVLTDGSVLVGTLEGRMEGGPDDWLIRGLEGELYPCKASIFDASYEPA